MEVFIKVKFAEEKPPKNHSYFIILKGGQLRTDFYTGDPNCSGWNNTATYEIEYWLKQTFLD